jgi:PAS domain S-box-containing protein
VGGRTEAPTSDAPDDLRLTRLLIESVVDHAIFVLDPRGFVRTWNRGAERLKGYTADEIVGRHFSSFYTATDRESGLPDALLVRAETEGAVSHSGWRVRKDGTTFWGDVTITALRDDTGELVGFAKVTRDRTQVHEQEEALGRALARERQAAVELEQLHRSRTRFLASIVHDLSTPIAVVRSSVQLAMDGQGSATASRSLGRLLAAARRSADELERLRSQLQEFSRLEAGAVELDLETIAVADLVQQLASDLNEVFEARIAVEIDPSLQVVADGLALRRILTNLLANAARYSPPGRPICVRTAPASTPDRVAIGVSDEGPGIRPADRSRVFQEFWSGRGGTRPEPGLGLGLSIARGYVAEHGGELWIDSTEGRGTTFWFTLPRAEPIRHARAEAVPPGVDGG